MQLNWIMNPVCLLTQNIIFNKKQQNFKDDTHNVF